MDPVHKALAEWREADEKARLAEAALAEALKLELCGGPPVDPTVLHQVANLRARADRMLSASINAMAEPREEPPEMRLQ